MLSAFLLVTEIGNSAGGGVLTKALASYIEQSELYKKALVRTSIAPLPAAAQGIQAK